MAFTNKRFSKDDKEAIIKKIVESEEIKDIMEAAITAKVQTALKNVPTVTAAGEDLVVEFKTGDGEEDIKKSYKLNKVDVAITEDENKNITVFEEYTSSN